MTDLSRLSNDELKNLVQKSIQVQWEHRQQNQLLYYRPVSELAEKIHLSTASVIGAGGGNGSAKTDSCLVEVAMCATGVIPESLKGRVEHKWRGPINCRIVVESLTTTLYPIILPKLQWFQWDGGDMPGGEKGHWGWIPRHCLIDGKWEKSWSDKLRTLRVICHDPWTGEPKGESRIQFMSVDNDATDFASGNFHLILHDEPPTHAIWKENRARAMRVSGRRLLAMTWPDDPAINVDWIFDEIYERGQGVNKDPEVEWITLKTTDNPFLDQDSVSRDAAQMGETERLTRIEGQPIRFSNRIHPDFSDDFKHWCFACKRICMPHKGACPTCGNDDIERFCHVDNVMPNRKYPTVFVIDPHPRKPHMMTWIQVDPRDDLQGVFELKVEGDCSEVAAAVFDLEETHSLDVVQRIGDPLMLKNPASQKRNVTWLDEFNDAGLVIDLADNSDVGRGRINEYLKPDPYTREPRIKLDKGCKTSIFQFNRYCWDDFRDRQDKDLKQRAKEKYDDFPTMWKYFLNTNPSFRSLKAGPKVIRWAG